jgi:hypothetical protein
VRPIEDICNIAKTELADSRCIDEGSFVTQTPQPERRGSNLSVYLELAIQGTQNADDLLLL